MWSSDTFEKKNHPSPPLYLLFFLGGGGRAMGKARMEITASLFLQPSFIGRLEILGMGDQKPSFSILNPLQYFPSCARNFFF